MEKRKNPILKGILTPVKYEDLYKFIDMYCSCFSLDDDGDRAALCQTLLENFSIYTEERT